MRVHSDPKRADDPHALPDIQVFYHEECEQCDGVEGAEDYCTRGWYWQPRTPGDPVGPFDTEAAALADAQGEGE